MKLFELPHSESEVCFHQLQEKELSNLRLPEIMRYFLQARGQKNVLMDGSARGPELQLSAEEYQQLTTPAVNFYLPKPFRLTNVQLYVPVVKRICQEFYQRTGHVLTANLYYTPARDLPFFDYHSDPQHSIVYQLEGEKEWFFQKTLDEQFLREQFENLKVVGLLNAGKLNTQEISYTLKPQQCMSFPYCFIHRAANATAAPSVHLTFAYNRPTLGGLVQFVARLLAKSDGAHFRPLPEEELLKAMRENASFTRALCTQYFEHFQEMEQEKLTHGRGF